MEDPHAAVHQALYARIGSVPDDISAENNDSSWSGLFTRPAMLALKDEMPRGMPLRSLNRACRLMLRKTAMPAGDDSDFLDEVAEACGFPDTAAFADCFLNATGWDPLEWLNRFGSDSGGPDSGGPDRPYT